MTDAGPRRIGDVPVSGIDCLRECPLFVGLDTQAFDSMVADVTWWSVPAGTALCEEGAEADAAYVLVEGRLESHRGDVLLGEHVVGDVVGEAGLLGAGRRAATVIAVRDAVVAGLDDELLQSLATVQPAAALHLAAVTAQRLAPGSARSVSRRRPHLVGLVPLSAGADVSDLAEELGHRVSSVVSSKVIGWPTMVAWIGQGGSGEVRRRLAAIEADVGLTLIAGGGGPAEWTDVMQQVDLLLGVGLAGERPDQAAVNAFSGSSRPTRLVLRRRSHGPVQTGGWEAVIATTTGAPSITHMEMNRSSDMARLARLLTGHSIGLVLGGGGARGFAHIGAVRALAEAGVIIDRVGGSSMGGIIGAQVAAGWNPDRLLHENRAAWSRRRLIEPAWPSVSLAKGERALVMLRRFFGDARIEELPLEFFCTTADLTAFRLHVATRGPVAEWVAASGAVPGLWPPSVDADGHFHADGGVLDNVPTEVMSSRGLGPVIAVDVCAAQAPMKVSSNGRAADSLSPLRRGDAGAPSFLELMTRANLLASLQQWERARDHADVYLTPDTGPHGFGSFDRVTELAELGYRSTAAAIEDGALGGLDARV